MFNVKDVRPIVKAYQGKDIPIEYAKKEAEAKRVAIEEWERRNPGGAAGGGGAGWLGGLFGGVAVSIQDFSYPHTRLASRIAWLRAVHFGKRERRSGDADITAEYIKGKSANDLPRSKTGRGAKGVSAGAEVLQGARGRVQTVSHPLPPSAYHNAAFKSPNVRPACLRTH